MSDDPKPKSEEGEGVGGEGDAPAKKPYAGESKESVTKIERRRSDAPLSTRGDGEAGKLDVSSDRPKVVKVVVDDEPKVPADKTIPMDVEAQAAAAVSSAKKKERSLDDDEPTGAQTPIAKKEKDEPKSTSKSLGAKPKSVVVEEEPPVRKKRPVDDDDDDAPVRKKALDDDAELPKVRRPGDKAPARTARKDGGGGRGGGGGGGRPTGGGGEGDGRRRRAATESGGLVILVAAGLVLGNLALKGFAKRIDTTREERYSLSKKGTGHLLSTLTKPLHIKVFAPKGLATIDAFVDDLKDLLREYENYGNGKLTWEVVLPDALEGEQKTKAEAEAQEAGLKKEILGEGKGTGQNAATIGQGYFGMLMTYGGEKALISREDGLDERNPMGLEFLISNKIRELRDKEDHIEHHIGYLQGHKEHGYQELSQVFNKYFPYYKLDAVDLSKGEKEVDTKLDGLIVTQPEEEIPSKELRRIDAFLMTGKAIAVFANTLHIKDADVSMNTNFTGMGLDKWLSGYGIDFKNELIFDKEQFWTPVLAGPNGLGIQLEPYPLIFMGDASRGDTTIDNKFPPVFRLPQVAVPFPEEITIDKARAGGDAVKINPVIRTTPNVVTVQGTAISLNPVKGLGQGATGQKDSPRKKGEEAILAVDMEGPIKSAFPGGGEGVEGVPTNAPASARLFVVSSGYYFGNPFQDAGKSPFGGMMPGMDPNMGADEDLMRYAQIYQRARMTSLLVAKQTCDWISQETDLLAAGAKLLAEPELTYPNSPAPTPSPDEKPDSDSFKKKKAQWIDQIKSQQRTTQYMSTFGGALILCFIGLARWYMRTNQRASVKL